MSKSNNSKFKKDFQTVFDQNYGIFAIGIPFSQENNKKQNFIGNSR